MPLLSYFLLNSLQFKVLLVTIARIILLVVMLNVTSHPHAYVYNYNSYCICS